MDTTVLHELASFTHQHLESHQHLMPAVNSPDAVRRDIQGTEIKDGNA